MSNTTVGVTVGVRDMSGVRASRHGDNLHLTVETKDFAGSVTLLIPQADVAAFVATVIGGMMAVPALPENVLTVTA